MKPQTPFHDYDWHVLIIPPHRLQIKASEKRLAERQEREPEPLVQSVLHQEGFATFLPARRTYRKPHRFAKTQQKVERRFPLLPGYLFLGVSDRTPGVWRALSYDMVRAVLVDTHDRPARIPVASLEHLNERSAKGAFSAPGYQRMMRSGREFHPGDEAEVLDGPMSGYRGKVQRIEGEVARVILPLFGDDREVSVGVDNLAAA